MAQDLFRVELGFADDNISYLSGSGAPFGAQADAAGVGSKWTDITNGDTYTKTSMPSTWSMMATGGSTGAIQTEIDAIETAVGLNPDGTYTAPAGTNYLGATTTVKGGLVALDTATKAASDAAAQVATNLSNYQTAQDLRDDGQDTAIAGKVNKSGDAMTGNLAFGGTHTVTGLAEPVNGDDAATKNYVDNAVTGLSWKEPVNSVGTSLPTTATTGDRFLNLTDDKIYTATATDTWNSGVAPGANWAVLDQATDQGYTFNGTDWVQFTGAGQIDAGVGLAKVGNTININLGAGIVQLPSDEVGIDVRSAGGLFLTEDGTTASSGTDAQLAVKLDGTSLAVGVNGLKVSDGITSAVAANTSGLAQEIIDRTNADNAIIAILNPLVQEVQTSIYRQATRASITTATVIDSVPVANKPVVKWLVYIRGLNADAGKFQAVEIHALNNSTGGNATAVDYTSYAKLKIGSNISGLAVTVELGGGGSLMEVKVASTNGVNAWVVGTTVNTVN